MRILVLLIVLAIPMTAYQQGIVNDLNDRINHDKLQKHAEKEVKNFFKEIHSATYFKTIVCKPIPSFTVSREGSAYKEGESLVGYLEPDKNEPAEYVVTLKENKYDGVVNIILNQFASKTYDSTMREARDTKGAGYDLLLNYHEAWRILEKRNYSLVFSVRYLKNYWWFVEEGKLYVIDLKKSAVYLADDFMRENCSTEVVRKLSRGSQAEFCK